MRRRAVIMGAGGRDFHDFNVFFRSNPDYEVVAFTASPQVPFISDRLYPSQLAGGSYAQGIRIYAEELLPELVRQHRIQDVFFAYSDVSHETVMHAASVALAAGASFHLLGPQDTMLEASKPVIAVVATRTGAGKSMVTRLIADVVQRAGLRPVVVRHPMAYGDFRWPVQVFATADDLDRYGITLEEREEFQTHVEHGIKVYAGVDYAGILTEASRASDVILWDGGNNDTAFYRPGLTVTVADPLRAGHELRYHPGETNVRLADIIAVNKANVASSSQVEEVVNNVHQLNTRAKVVRLGSEAHLEPTMPLEGRRVLVVEDGPSVTHGGLGDGVGAFVARRAGAQLVDPRNVAVGSLRAAFERFPQLGPVLPALGYSRAQLEELQVTIRGVQCDAVVLGTPADLGHLLKIDAPVLRVRFEAQDMDMPGLRDLVAEYLRTTRL
jgi:predicted GTPase